MIRWEELLYVFRSAEFNLENMYEVNANGMQCSFVIVFLVKTKIFIGYNKTKLQWTYLK